MEFIPRSSASPNLFYHSQKTKKNYGRHPMVKNESEQREQEYQLCREEMEIACEEAHTQRQMMSAHTQMMNAIFMLMLNKNGGGSNNPPPIPSNT